MSADLGLSTASGGGSSRADVVVWARALGVRSGEEVWEHVAKTSADIARLLDDLSAVVSRVSEYPDEELHWELSRAFGRIEGVGQALLRVARSTHTD
ncbi:hypothetical protein [Aquipuribacter nitratireducens]|uniref:Uncharacterized protein n=1 Tax=Aquipuribacter nitratireducens TaxID=650104 RepID=A0ABW0GMI7_9MICO